MARPRKTPFPVRLEVRYEYVPDNVLQPAIVVLASMLRDIRHAGTVGNKIEGSIVYKVEPSNERV